MILQFNTIHSILHLQAILQLPLHGSQLCYGKVASSMKIWALPCRTTQDKQVIMSSDKTWSTGEGKGNPFQYSCLENPIDSIKGKKICWKKRPWCWERLKAKGKGWWWGAEDEMVRQHHPLNGHESEQTLGESGGQRKLECYSPWGCEESDTT